MRLLLFFLTLSMGLGATPLKLNVSAKSAILINADTGAILYEKAAHDRVFPASITKIATCLYALKNQEDIDEVISCPSHCLRKMNKSVKVAHGYKDPAYLLEPDGTHFWIKRGEELPFRDLLYGLMLASGNDAANFIAHHVGGSIPKFMKGMNVYLKNLGCVDTHFCNPHGLHHPHHMTTAYDIALITKEALKYESIRTIAGTNEYERSATNLQAAKTVQQNNMLIQPGKFFYPRAIGMKTGYTSDAGYNLTSVAKEGGRTLIAVLLGCGDSHSRYKDAIRLFDTAFEQEKEHRLLFNKEENIFSRHIPKAKHSLQAVLKEDVSLSYYPAEEPDITIELNWEHLNPPVMQGSYVGALKVLTSKGDTLESIPLIAMQNVERSFYAIIGDGFKGEWKAPTELLTSLGVFLALGVFLSIYGIYRMY